MASRNGACGRRGSCPEMAAAAAASRPVSHSSPPNTARFCAGDGTCPALVAAESTTCRRFRSNARRAVRVTAPH